MGTEAGYLIISLIGLDLMSNTWHTCHHLKAELMTDHCTFLVEVTCGLSILLNTVVLQAPTANWLVGTLDETCSLSLLV